MSILVQENLKTVPEPAKATRHASSCTCTD